MQASIGSFLPAAMSTTSSPSCPEAGRLLEAVADAEAGALGDGFVRDVLAVEEDWPLVGSSMPMMSLASVDLPPPLGPVMTVKRSSGMVEERSSMMRLVPRRRPAPRTPGS